MKAGDVVKPKGPQRVQWRCWECDLSGFVLSEAAGQAVLGVHLEFAHQRVVGAMGDVRVVLPG